MNGTAIGVQELTCQLLDTAAGIPAGTAAAAIRLPHPCWPSIDLPANNVETDTGARRTLLP